jgi:hypothetical protein
MNTDKHGFFDEIGLKITGIGVYLRLSVVNGVFSKKGETQVFYKIRSA